MAKSLRSKVRRRLRNCRAEHLYQTVGQYKMAAMSQRLNDPTYDIKKEYAPPVNAYLEPNNPEAVFPQTEKPIIPDFRTHKMENGGLTAIGVGRKHMQKNAKHSKYAPVIKTREECDAEEAEEKRLKALKLKQLEESSSEEEMVPSEPISVDELTAMAGSMKIGKKQKKDVEMQEKPQITIKSRGIKKDTKCRKSKRQVSF